ncbi:hypothetical protein OROGR_021414 [Orobanche gracilis]
MSGFFTLDGNFNKDHQDHHHHHPTDNNNNSLFLFKNEEIYNKGFELWQQYYQLHQQRQNHHHHHQDVDFSVGPQSRRNNDIIFSGNNNNNNGGGEDQSSSYNSDRSAAGFRVMRQSRSAGGNESINCQDCGNQAKKDCAHLRCRTCCKSRGFHCQTHVKSTWVPAAKRRERQQQQLSTRLQPDQLDDAGRGENLKRMRENPGCSGGGGGRGSAFASTNSRLPETTTGFELGHFPAEVNSPAVFRCVRVSSADDAGEHLAYQTAVNIGGHVFKGILYHQGPENRPQADGDISSGFGGSQQPQHQQLHLTAGHNLNTTTTMLDPSIYPMAPLNAFMAGTQFFPTPTTH